MTGVPGADGSGTTNVPNASRDKMGRMSGSQLTTTLGGSQFSGKVEQGNMQKFGSNSDRSMIASLGNKSTEKGRAGSMARGARAGSQNMRGGRR